MHYFKTFCLYVFALFVLNFCDLRVLHAGTQCGDVSTIKGHFWSHSVPKRKTSYELLVETYDYPERKEASYFGCDVGSEKCLIKIIKLNVADNELVFPAETFRDLCRVYTREDLIKVQISSEGIYLYFSGGNAGRWYRVRYTIHPSELKVVKREIILYGPPDRNFDKPEIINYYR